MKKGELSTTQIFTIGEIILALSIVAFLYLFAQHVLDDTTFERSVLSKDQAFLINNIQSQPINTKELYTAENIEKYIFCYIEGVYIYENKGELSISHPFFINPAINNQLGYADNCVEYVNNNIYFEKNADSFIIENKKPSAKYICPYGTNKVNSILFDPLKDFNNPGQEIFNTGKYSYELNSLIIESTIDFLNARNLAQDLDKTRDISSEELTLTDKEVKIENNDFVLILDTFTNAESNYAYIYYNSKSFNSSYWSCKIANSLYLNGINTYLIPKNPEEDTNLFLIQNDKKSIVYIEFYLLNSENSFEDYPLISESIGEVIFNEIK